MRDEDDLKQAQGAPGDDGHDDYAARAAAAAAIAARALERNAPGVALAAVQEAARAALLALSHVPDRHTNEDLRFLSALAADPPDSFSGRSDTREAALRRALLVLSQMIPPVPVDEEATPAPRDAVAPPKPRLRVLLAEDEWFIAEEAAECLERAGVEVLGPVPTVDDALRLVRAASADGGISAAVLDFNLSGAPATPVAEALAATRVPFLYVTGYPPNHLRDRFPEVPILEKPFHPDALLRGVLTLGAPRQGTAKVASAQGAGAAPGLHRLGGPGPGRVAAGHHASGWAGSGQ
ncbi:hypothetical protein VQH23_06460 [Pararoseomonas sp. SCSIO 73927]|uniref:hypothetical protein n=1 Tax=Pararoseomonas sp. SCSIO 73927 TaxID=3114537 RepID=UPI0030D15199